MVIGVPAASSAPVTFTSDAFARSVANADWLMARAVPCDPTPVSLPGN